jgi:uncharacterized protein YqgC (DUF456 family)
MKRIFNSRVMGIVIGFFSIPLLPIFAAPLVVAIILARRENTKLFGQGMLIGLASLVVILLSIMYFSKPTPLMY